MYKLSLGILLSSLMVFSSCKKCQTCTTKVTQDIGFIPVSTTTTEEYCGKEYDDAPEEVSVDQNVGGISQSVEITCVDS